MKSLLNHGRKPTDLYCLIGLIALTSIISTIYISHEQYFYFWDYSHYSNLVNELASKLRESPFKAIECFIDYLVDDYTQIPSLPLLPFALLFGNSRQVFILSLSLVYIVPFCLITGKISTEVFTFPSRYTFWTTAFLTLFTPATWVSILRGYPDLGGASIISLAILLYWKDPQLKKRSQIIQLAGLLALSAWFRRPFAYSVRAFLLTIFLIGIVDYFIHQKQNPKPALKEFRRIIIQISKIIAWFIIFSPVLIFKILFIDYRNLFASYEMSTHEVYSYYIHEFGWVVFSLTILGYTLGLFNQIGRSRKYIFFLLMGIISIIQWIFFAKQNGSHYTTSFISFVIIGLVTLLFFALKNSAKINKISIFIFSIGIGTVINNMLFALTSLGEINFKYRSLFPVTKVPLYRSDVKEVARLVNFLRTNSTKDKAIYVAASSQILTSDTLIAAEQQIYGTKQLKILRTSNIDSRDTYPLNELLKSHFIVVATPIQYHLPAQEQKVVTVAVEAFEKSWSFANDFQKIPVEFFLENGVNVKIYQRIRETPFATVLETLQLINKNINRNQVRETQWLMLQSEKPMNINKDIFRTVQLYDIPLAPGESSSFLYFGPTGSSIRLQGKLSTSHCANLGKLVLHLSALNQKGQVLSAQPMTYPIENDINIASKPLPPQVAYLRLDIQRLDSPNGQSKQECSISINNVTVSDVK
jgi:hypothetical protein